MARETREEAIERGLNIAAEKGIDGEPAHLKEAIGIGYDLLYPTLDTYLSKW